MPKLNCIVYVYNMHFKRHCVAKMVLSRVFGQLLILLTIFYGIRSECISAAKGKSTQQQVCNRYCEYKLIWSSPDIYKCQNSNIEEINKLLKSQDNPEHIIYVYDSNISSLEPNTNSQFWNKVKEFHLDDTNTSTIIPGFFKNFDKLQLLQITNNQLNEVVDGVFSSIQTLSSLNLSSNFIEKLTSHSFSGLLELTILDISNNKISSISPEVFRYQHFLKQVNLSQNLLKEVGHIFSHNHLIININLSNNQLIDFDFFQFSEHDLNILDLSNNLLENITSLEYFFSLNIRELNVGHNKISNISAFLFANASNLESLHLDHNSLKEISRESFINNKNILYLDLSSNNIIEIPFGLFNDLDKLTYLDLSDNQMILDFHTLTTLKSLETLKLQNNFVKNFDPNVLVSRFYNLSFISLGNNLLNCSELANTINLLQMNKIDIYKGKDFKTDNIFGISCKNNINLKEEDIIFERNIQNPSIINGNNKNSLSEFLNQDFKNTTFYTFFKNFLQEYSLQNKSFVSSQNNDIGKNAFIQYLNENFTKTHFFKYLESINLQMNKSTESHRVIDQLYSQIQNIANSSSFISQAIFNSVNFSILNQNLQKVIDTHLKTYDTNKNALEIQSKILKNLEQQIIISKNTSDKFFNILKYMSPVKTKYEHQALTQQNFENDENIHGINLVLNNILLTLIFFSILGVIYLYFFKHKKYKPGNLNEDVQLI